ncbi:jg679, partial [Pararge aegeria aegeria]
RHKSSPLNNQEKRPRRRPKTKGPKEQRIKDQDFGLQAMRCFGREDVTKFPEGWQSELDSVARLSDMSYVKPILLIGLYAAS